MVKPMSNGGPPEFFIIRYDIFRTKAGVAMTTIACPLILYSIRASFVSLLRITGQCVVVFQFNYVF